MKKRYLKLLTMLMVAFVSVAFASCGGDDDNNGLGLSDTEVVTLLQGTWSVSFNGRTEAWVFSGNNVKGVYGVVSDYPFKVSDGVLLGQAFEAGLVLTKLTSTSFEAYYVDDPSERYSGTKRTN
jgi:hypothetical protein